MASSASGIDVPAAINSARPRIFSRQLPSGFIGQRFLQKWAQWKQLLDGNCQRPKQHSLTRRLGATEQDGPKGGQ